MGLLILGFADKGGLKGGHRFRVTSFRNYLNEK
jgi:hypothetical protein